ncbi:MAG: hydrogenase maturation protease, partial [Anaerolineae bacterium]|nr:hydrogenase maturation protease [Anaerolineae bacterium]
MNDFLVIGYGNPLRGDDGVGWRVVEALEESLSASSLIAVHQLTPELAGTISEVGQVVFVDATAGNSPGEVELF